MIKFIYKSFVYIITLYLFATTSTMLIAEEVNVYSARKQHLIKPLLDRFSEEMGIEVNLITAKAGSLLKRLELEADSSPADVLITVDAGNLDKAKRAEVLQVVRSSELDKAIPVHLRDKDDYWFGLTVRARPIFYRKGKVKPKELSTYENLADEQWRGRICIRSSNNIYNQSLVASMLVADGKDKVQQWANSFVKNFARKPQGGDRDQIKAVAAGVCDLAIANSYYYAGMLISKDDSQRLAAEQVAIFWPNQSDRGSHINISGAAVTKAAPNRENAIRLLEFMVRDESQFWYAKVNGEYPVKDGVDPSPVLKKFGSFRADDLNLSELGTNNAEAVFIMDRAGWK